MRSNLYFRFIIIEGKLTLNESLQVLFVKLNIEVECNTKLADFFDDKYNFQKNIAFIHLCMHSEGINDYKWRYRYVLVSKTQF